MKKITIDANSAVAKVAYKLSEVIPVYPITPSTAMAEYCTSQSSLGEKNLFNESVTTFEMQSEAGVAGTLHGALLGGALSSTFTCSQGLLLMVPEMYKIAGEGLPAVIHVSARSISSHALSIFGDHSDVMSVRPTGFTMICSSNVQEAQDMAVVAHVCATKYSMPILHFFDGFRTSHEFQKIEEIEDSQILSLFPRLEDIYIKQSPLSPNNPKMYGTAQNPDVFFQNKERNNLKYESFSKNFAKELDNFYKETNRRYHPFEYFGSPNPKYLIISMGSSVETIIETLSNDNETAVIAVRLFRPFDGKYLLSLIPNSVEKICVLDRTKEAGSANPLYLDVCATILNSDRSIKVVGGRYGIGGKEFSPKCVKAIIDNIKSNNPKENFTVGINDDITNSSLELKEYFNNVNQTQIKIYGLGSDGSISASKSIIKILGDNTDKYVQGFFEYDSKKAGSLTISHLRLSTEKIRSTYLVNQPNIICINNFSFIHRYDCLKGLQQNGIVLINSIFSSGEIDKILPNRYKTILQEKNAKLFIINAQKIAMENGLDQKINIIMESALFKVAKLLNLDIAKENIEKQIEKNFAKKGKEVVDKNLDAMKESFDSISEVDVSKLTIKKESEKENSSEGFSKIMKSVQALEGNSLPVSCFSCDGSIPTDTAKFEKRGIALRLPIWHSENCIQCGHCVLSCPHGALRAILVNENGEEIDGLNFKDAIGLKGYKYKIEISPKDCTGCGVCANTCPAIKKALTMAIAMDRLDIEEEMFEKTTNIPSKQAFSTDFVKGLQFCPSYFKFSGACAGCGETPYIKLATQLFGDKMLIANATGCSSIYGGSFPSCPFSKDENGKGPAWASSLFEDNAEFGLGIKLASSYAKNEDKSIWIIGGDGWATDIGFGGLDHVLQSNANVNILVLDNETYSNTGGQASKSTPIGACVKFAENGKKTKKKNLGLIAMSYQNAYVAQVSLGANYNQCIKAFKEAEAFDGPSIIIAYSPCVEHGYDMSKTMEEMKKAVETGYWNLYRFNPKTGLSLDSSADINTNEFTKGERRFNKTSPSLSSALELSNKNNLEILKFLASLYKNDKSQN